MAYTIINFKTKKALKEAVAAWNEYNSDPSRELRDFQARQTVGYVIGLAIIKPEPIRCFQPGLGPDLSKFTGSVALEGPHYPAPHSWYASAVLKDGVVVKVK